MLRHRRKGPNEPAQAQGRGQLYPETGEDDSSTCFLISTHPRQEERHFELQLTRN